MHIFYIYIYSYTFSFKPSSVKTQISLFKQSIVKLNSQTFYWHSSKSYNLSKTYKVVTNKQTRALTGFVFTKVVFRFLKVIFHKTASSQLCEWVFPISYLKKDRWNFRIQNKEVKPATKRNDGSCFSSSEKKCRQIFSRWGQFPAENIFPQGKLFWSNSAFGWANLYTDLPFGGNKDLTSLVSIKSSPFKSRLCFNVCWSIYSITGPMYGMSFFKISLQVDV